MYLKMIQFHFISAAICEWKFDLLNFSFSVHVVFEQSAFLCPYLHKQFKGLHRLHGSTFNRPEHYGPLASKFSERKRITDRQDPQKDHGDHEVFNKARMRLGDVFEEYFKVSRIFSELKLNSKTQLLATKSIKVTSFFILTINGLSSFECTAAQGQQFKSTCDADSATFLCNFN